MLSQLIRVASEAGTYAGDGQDYNIGETSTQTSVRKVNNGYIDGRAHPSINVDNQLEAFRGTVYAAADKIAKRVAQIPLRLIQCEHTGNDAEPTCTTVHMHPFMTLFNDANGHKPHEEYSVWELKYTMQVSLDTTGESWLLVERDAMGRPSRVTPLPANRMVVVFDKNSGLIAGYFFCPKGTTPEEGGVFIPKRPWKYLLDRAHWTEPFVTFMRYPSPRGIEEPRGWSPVKAAAHAYDINLYEQIYKKNFLQQGAQLGGILQSEVALSKDQIEEYLEQFKLRHSGISKAGLPMVLPKMLKWSTTEPSPRDMQWAEAVNLTQSQILQIYGISDAKLGRADIGNRNTADAMDVTFNREVIQSRLDIITSKLNTDFLPVYPGQTDGLYFSVKFDDPVPGDGEMALKREQQDITLGVRTPNEVRASRNDKHLKPYGKFGDQVYKPLNQIPIDPFATTLEISQDDMEKLGFVDPKEQAEIDALANPDAGAAGGKKDGEVDPKAADKGKKDAKKSFGRSLHRTPDDPALDAILAFLYSKDAREQWRLHIAGIIETSIREEIELAASLVGELVDSIDPVTIAAEWARELDIHIAGISETTADAIRETIAEGLANGDTLVEIRNRIDEVFEFGDRIRSATIARTEVLGANNFAALAVYKRAGVPFKRWLTVMDGRERDTHADADQQLVRLDAKFIVGGVEMDHPGDPTAPAREVINCRCTLVPEFDASRSVWDDKRLSAIWEAFDVRMANNESHLRDAARLVFQQQHARVISILNHFSR